MNDHDAPASPADAEPLYLFDRDEWYRVARLLKPDITDEEYDAMWEQAKVARAQGRPQ